MRQLCLVGLWIEVICVDRGCLCVVESGGLGTSLVCVGCLLLHIGSLSITGIAVISRVPAGGRFGKPICTHERFLNYGSEKEVERVKVKTKLVIGNAIPATTKINQAA